MAYLFQRKVVTVMGLLALSGTVFCASAHAEGGLFGSGTSLDASYCKMKAPRQTIVYIDNTDMLVGQIDWAKRILQKLQQTLMPGERTTVVELSPTDGQNKEIWSGCWPAVTSGQAASMAKEHHFFSGDPLAGIQEQQGFFARDFGASLTKIWKPNAHVESGGGSNDDIRKNKSILRSISSDGARYSSSYSTSRLIIYSDMAENSDLGSVFSTSASNDMQYGDKLGIDLHHSVVYIFGLGVMAKEDGKVSDNIHQFWKNAFRSMSANVMGMGSDLNVPNAVPVEYKKYSIVINNNGSMASGFVSLLVTGDGHLVDSWIDADRIAQHSVLLKPESTWRCTSGETACELNATTEGGFVTDGKGDKLTLKSSGNISSLSGSIGVPDQGISVPVTAQLISDN